MVSRLAPLGTQETREETQMAEATPATTRPARARTRSAVPAAKAAPAKVASAKAPVSKTDVTRFQVELEHNGTTKSYEKFSFPDSYKGTVVGNVYAPIGTERVVVLVIGAGDVEPNTAE